MTGSGSDPGVIATSQNRSGDLKCKSSECAPAVPAIDARLFECTARHDELRLAGVGSQSVCEACADRRGGTGNVGWNGSVLAFVLAMYAFLSGVYEAKPGIWVLASPSFTYTIVHSTGL